MRVLLIGAVEFSLCAFEKLIDLNVNLVGVCTKDTSTFNSDIFCRSVYEFERSF